MRVYSLDTHSNLCKNGNHYCSPANFIFQYDFDFHLLIYPSCHTRYNELDFNLEILNLLSKSRKKKDVYGKVTKSNPIKDVIRNRKIDALINNKYEEICYEYSDNAGKGYSMVKTVAWDEYLAHQITYMDNFRSACKDIDAAEFIDERRKEWLKEELSGLIRANNYSDFDCLSDIQKVTLTQILTKGFFKTQLV